VHGFQVLEALRLPDAFQNAAVNTWIDFQNLTEELEAQFPWWKTCDLYFWSYSSATDRIRFSAQDLHALIQKIYPRPAPGLLILGAESSTSILGLQLSKIDAGFERAYSKLLLVAHSEGGIVLREAVLKFYSDRRAMAAAVGQSGAANVGDSVLRAEVRLFSPALMGASLSGLLGFFYNFFPTRALLEPLLESLPGFQDLQPTNRNLAILQSETENAAEAEPTFRAFRARVLYGRCEHYVHPGTYTCDHSEKAEIGENHTTVCKPRKDYTKPLKFVKHDPPY
jgi:hypothetical protein